ncbi:MAG: 3D domain-containing protein [Pseudomonadota bacterium]
MGARIRRWKSGLALLALGTATCQTYAPPPPEPPAAPAIAIAEPPHPVEIHVAPVIATPVATAAPAPAAEPPALDIEDQVLQFRLPAPSLAVLHAPPLSLWATNYYTPRYETAETGTPLIDRNNQPISGPLTDKQWCNIALQGSAAITEPDGQTNAFVFMGSRGPEQVNCDRWFPNLPENIRIATRKARFNVITHRFGCGIKDWSLMPYRTIAVDSAIVPYQTTLFIPALVGKRFEIDGEPYRHDGYVFAADRGGAVIGNQIDFFSGNDRRVGFTDVITSTPDGAFEAFRIPAAAPAALTLAELHDVPCAE